MPLLHRMSLFLALFDRFECPSFGRCWGQTGHQDRAKMERMTRNGHACSLSGEYNVGPRWFANAAVALARKTRNAVRVQLKDAVESLLVTADRV